MVKLRYFTVVSLMLMALAAYGGSQSTSAQGATSLGTAGNFAVLAGSTATNTGTSVLTGNLGVWPGTEITGFPPGVVNGTTHNGDAVAQQAQTDLTIAYNNLVGLPCDVDLSGTDLGGQILTEGVYCFADSAQLTGELTLDAQGNSDAAFTFQIGSTLTTATGSSVLVINAGSPCNLLWQVGSSATLGSSTSFPGTILALTSITMNTSANVNGRALAINGAVTMDTNSISNAMCQVVVPTETPTPVLTQTLTSTPTQTPTATLLPASPTATQTVTSTSPSPTTTPGTSETVTPNPTTTPGTSETITPNPTTTPGTSETVTPNPTTTPGTSETVTPNPTITITPVANETVTPSPTVTATPFVVRLPDTGGSLLQGATLSIHAARALSPATVQPAKAQTSAVMDTPFELRFPSLNISLPLSSVGLTADNVMDVPRGSVNDPVWQTAFWYRGSRLPGEGGTMTVAGHVTDLLGQPGAFAHLSKLRSGDVIVVYDEVHGRDIEYIVTDTQTYSSAESADPLVIAKVYGHGPYISGRSYLTLITCAGTFVNGSFVDRLVVYAQMAVNTIPLHQVE